MHLERRYEAVQIMSHRQGRSFFINGLLYFWDKGLCSEETKTRDKVQLMFVGVGVRN